ncbi:hypothetical protein SUGI_0582300 [Cryptomeria japonica]|uniref:phospholipase A(1) DAD1, chloroplastic n=1 Tax=Cryptomeria japonica TaxID=3369 RepID=UPI002414728D|nr:phospholipase A(1) DAD1, chloroplastic [Cryptomeria japonica]GLJ29532.1 hypothetical protein SUGI_0582300 [Cryptomeria japonica]
MQAAKPPLCALKSFTGPEGDGSKFKMPALSKRSSFNVPLLSLRYKDACFNGIQALTAGKFAKHWPSSEQSLQFVEDSGNLAKKSGNLAENYGKFVEKSGNFVENSGNFAENSCKFVEKSGNLAENSGDAPSSPKQMLGLKWWEYAGSNDWKGLLDPLDSNLRREIIKYGELVQASYSACDFDPQSRTYGRCKYPEESLLTQLGLQSTGYRVTHHIHATSAIKVPQWLTALVSSFSHCDATWMSRRTNWIGYVAVCDDDVEVARLGRRDIVVAFRGTVTPLEWLENFRDILTPVTVTGQRDTKVQTGFWNLYTCRDSNGRSPSSDVLDELKRLVDLYAGEEISITVTGHSLGAALALLCAYQVGKARFRCKPHRSVSVPVPVTVFSFGGPRVGNRAFGRRIEEMKVKVLRMVNTQDVITKVPGVVLNQDWSRKSWIFRYLERNGWAYRHVGTELRVSNKNSPYLKPDADMACCHDLEAYLHLIDGFFSSSVPFRKSAKRDILRLLVNQKSNVLLKAAAGKNSRVNRRGEVSL